MMKTESGVTDFAKTMYQNRFSDKGSPLPHASWGRGAGGEGAIFVGHTLPGPLTPSPSPPKRGGGEPNVSLNVNSELRFEILSTARPPSSGGRSGQGNGSFARSTTVVLAMIVMFAAVLPAVAQQPADPLPVLRLRPDGVRESINHLAFSADGKTLFASGYNKRVDVWELKDGEFVRDHSLCLRHAIGPGPTGTILAMDISADDRFVAVGGIGAITDGADFRTEGIVIPAHGFGRKLLGQLGRVTLFDRQNRSRRAVPSHLGYVLAIDVVEVAADRPTLLVVLGNDEVPMQCDGGAAGQAEEVGRSIRVIDPADGQQLAVWPVPVDSIAPAVAGWLTRPGDVDSLCVATSTSNGRSGGVRIYRMGRDDFDSIEDPRALAITVAGGNLLLSQNGVLGKVDIATRNRSGAIGLGGNLSPAQVIYRVAASADGSVLAITTRDLSNPTAGHQLHLVDRQTSRLVGRPADIGKAQNPAVAIDPGGQFIAATADVAAGLLIFRVADLRAGRTEPMQRIGSDFLPIERAALAQNGDRIQGLRLLRRDQTGKPSRLDLIGGKLRPVDSAAWRSFNSPIAFDRRGKTATVQPRGSVGGRALVLPEVETMLPPVGAASVNESLGGVPIAAVGSVPATGEGSCRLELVDGRNGEVVRQLNGHDGAITSIEFSKAGDRLTTVSADGVVCVWSLDDLGDVVDQMGTLRGVQFCHDGRSLIVTKVDDDARVPLRVGDAVAGLVTGDDLQTFPTVATMLRGLSFLAPGSDAILRVGRGGRSMDLAVPLVQGTDERKPLFSVVLRSAPADGDESLHWLAWSPHGPFEASDEAIGQRAGWHFNRIEGNEEIRFAPLAEYRERFFGRGLMHSLLTAGRVPDVWPPAAVPGVTAAIDIGDGNDLFADGRRFDLPGGKIASLQILVDGIAPTLIDRVEVSIDGGESQNLSALASDPELWRIVLPRTFDPETEHQLHAKIHSARVAGGVHADQWLIAVPPQQPPAAPRQPDIAKIEIDGDDPGDLKVDLEPDPQPAASSLPSVRIVSHRDRSVSQTPAGWDGDLSLTLRARVEAAAIDPAWEFTADVDGQIHPLTHLKVSENLIAGQIELPVGRHFVTLQLSDGEETVKGETVLILRRDPPEIESFTATLNPDSQSSADAVLVVRSGQPLLDRQFETLVEGIGFDHMPIDIAEVPGQPDRYRVTIQSIPLSLGENRIECRVIGDDGSARSPVESIVDYEPRVEPPELFVGLDQTAAVNLALIEFDVRVIDEAPVNVSVSVSGKSIDVPVPQMLDERTQRTQLNVPLGYGANRIVVTATRGDQSATSVHDVSRIEPPSRIEIDHLLTDDGQRIEVARRGNRCVVDEPLPTAGLTLIGRVGLSSATGARPEAVRGFVNGFLQSTVALDVQNVGNGEFRLPLTLSAEQSVVRVDLPGLPESEDSHAVVSIGCTEPSTDQTLHLIVISTEVDFVDRQTLEDQVLTTFQVQNGVAPAFSRVVSGVPTYPTLTGEVRSDQIRSMLRRCKLQTKGRNAQNDVVLLYFQGQDYRADNDDFGLVTYDVLEDMLDDKSMISGNYLSQEFRSMRGAHLLFMDVTPHPRSVPETTARAITRPYLGVLRLARGGTDDPDASVSSMLDHVERCLPQVDRLRDLAEQMRSAPTAGDTLVFEDVIPEDLIGLRFGGGGLLQP